MMVCIYFVVVETVVEVEEEVILHCNGGISSVTIERRISSNMTSSILCVNVPVSRG